MISRLVAPSFSLLMNRTYNIAFDKLFHFYDTEKLELLPFLSVDLADIVGGSASCLAAITVSELPLGTIKLETLHCAYGTISVNVKSTLLQLYHREIVRLLHTL